MAIFFGTPPSKSSHQGSYSNRNLKPSKKKNNLSWTFHQQNSRLLNARQIDDSLHISLLRFTSSQPDVMFSTETFWRLPFKLKHLRSYLMYPYLGVEEKEDTELMSCLTSCATTQFKFEKLMYLRINNVVKALNAANENNKLVEESRKLNNSHALVSRLGDIYAVGFEENSFILDVLVKNNIKIPKY